MADEKSLSIGDYVSLVRGTTYQSSRLGEPGPVLLGLASIAPEGGFREGSLKTYGGPSANNHLLRPGELYVSLKDVTQAGRLLGAVARVPPHIPLGRLTQDTVKLEFKPGAPPANYVYWLLRTPEYREYCKERATGTTNLALSRSDFLAFPVPPLTATRAKICEALSALDDKIKLNDRTAETLEAMVQTLYQSWFVDFEPVRAKIEGCANGLSDGLATLFPNKFAEDGLPAGWRREPLLYHAHLISGGTPKTEEPAYWDGPILWASAKDVSQCPDHFLITTQRTITERGLEESATRLIPRFSTVVVARGATTGRHCMLGRDMAMNQTCYALNSRSSAPFWLYCTFGQIVDELVQSAHGSVFDTITTTTLGIVRVVAGDEKIVRAFEDQVCPLFERILSSIEESRLLETIRETLLPKLVSDELLVFNAKRIVAA